MELPICFIRVSFYKSRKRGRGREIRRPGGRPVLLPVWGRGPLRLHSPRKGGSWRAARNLGLGSASIEVEAAGSAGIFSPSYVHCRHRRLPGCGHRGLLSQQPAQARPAVHPAALPQLVSSRDDLLLPVHGPLQPERLEERAGSAHVQGGVRPDLRAGNPHLCRVVPGQRARGGPYRRQEGNPDRRLRLGGGQCPARHPHAGDSGGQVPGPSRGVLCGPLRPEHVFPKLRRRLHHQGQGLLVPRAGTGCVRRDLRDPDLARGLFRLRLGPVDL